MRFLTQRLLIVLCLALTSQPLKLGGQVASTQQLAAASGQVVPLSGERFLASLVSIDESWNFTFETPQRQVVLSSTALERWTSRAATVRSPLILLTDGSQIAAEVLGVEAAGIRIAGRAWRETLIPQEALVAILWQSPLAPEERDRWIRYLREDPAAAPRLAEVTFEFTNGDRLTGELLDSPVAERSGDSSTDPRLAELAVRVSDRQVELPVARLRAIRWPRPAIDRTPSVGQAEVHFRDGTRLNCRGLSVERDALRWETMAGVSFSSPAWESRKAAWARIRAVYVPSPSVVPLAELTSAQYEYIPVWSERREYRFNRAVSGTYLRHQDQWIPQGLGMHASSSLAFFLDGKYKSFRSDVAIDDSSGQSGSVIFRVYLTDDGQDWDLAFESPVVRGGEAALPCELDVAGRLAMTLTVEMADQGNVLDRANWLHARLLKDAE